MDPEVGMRADALIECIASVTFGDESIGNPSQQGNGWIVDKQDISGTDFRVEVAQSDNVRADVSRAPYLEIRGSDTGFAVFRMPANVLPDVAAVRQLYKR